MNKHEIINFASSAETVVKKHGTDYHLISETQGPYPYWNAEDSRGLPSVVKIFEMKQNAGIKRHNVVVGCSGVGDYFIWCGDNFIEGGNTKPSAEVRIIGAAKELSGRFDAESLMTQLRGKFSQSDMCHFWANYNKTGTLCKHCNQLLVHKQLHILEILQELDENFEILMDDNAKATEVTLPDAWFEKMATKVPVLLEGEKGWGKTREARIFAETVGAKLIEIQGHESVEAADLTGYTVRHGHDMVWKDGRLSQAFRLAAKGVKTCLLIDEALRIPQRQLSVLLSALSPHKGHYYLSTGRIVDVTEGIGSEETIACPVENLYVFATTNIGAQYAVDVMDPALQERFLLRRKYPDVAILKTAVLAAAAEKGFSDSVADKCVAFFDAMNSLKPHGLVTDTPNPRTMVRAVHLSDNESDMRESITAQILTWVGRDVDGNPVQEQLDAVLKAVKKVWK